jgi:hypothetical protein
LAAFFLVKSAGEVLEAGGPVLFKVDGEDVEACGHVAVQQSPQVLAREVANGARRTAAPTPEPPRMQCALSPAIKQT